MPSAHAKLGVLGVVKLLNAVSTVYIPVVVYPYQWVDGGVMRHVDDVDQFEINQLTFPAMIM